MNWVAVGAIGTVVTSVVIAVSVGFLLWQVRELRRATYAQVFANVVRVLQEEEVRKARRILFGLKGRPLEKWTEEERLTAERVCQSYDSVGIMVRIGLLPKAIVTRNWGDSLVRSWDAARPLVSYYRVERPDPELWDDFEWLAKEASQAPKKN
jgi:hypothetical protein